jgi:hypothetical protein
MVPFREQLLVRLDMVRKLKNSNFSIILISQFFQPLQVQTDFNKERQYTYNATLCVRFTSAWLP